MKKAITVIVMALAAVASISSAAIISVSNVGTTSVTTNLTTGGTTDWVMLGQGGGVTGIDNRDEKADASYIGEVTVTGTKDSWDGHASRYSWEDGTPTVSATDVLGNWEAKPLSGLATTDQALSFTVSDLAVGSYSMTVYANSFRAAQLLTATIGESSMTAVNDFNNIAAYSTYTVDFSIDTFGDSLNLDLRRSDTNNSVFSNVGISAITIAVIPEPATMGLVAFGLGFLFIRRRVMI